MSAVTSTINLADRLKKLKCTNQGKINEKIGYIQENLNKKKIEYLNTLKSVWVLTKNEKKNKKGTNPV